VRRARQPGGGERGKDQAIRSFERHGCSFISGR
jgi:hypothetical protein